MPTADELLAALERRPCGAALLAVLRELPGSWLVGGAVRDLALGREPHELDVAVDGDAAELAARLGGEAVHHGRFGTSVVRAGDCRYDVVRTRAETYAAPGALPDVRPGTLDDDLARRDFTVNAIAVRPGELRAVAHALDDLEARRLRVLHDGSFVDDPTRLWRLVRYAVRLGFLPEERTGELARAAVASGALDTVSGDRLGNELRLALAEPDPPAVLHAAQQLGLVAGLRIDPALVAAAHALRPAGEGDPRLITLGAVIPDGGWASGWGFDGAQERTLARCAALEPVAPGRPSAVRAALDGEPVEAVCVAGARGDPQTALRYLADWRHVRLEITGDDLLAAGVAPGPELGERLRRALAAKVDGEVSGRSSELSVALSLSSA